MREYARDGGVRARQEFMMFFLMKESGMNATTGGEWVGGTRRLGVYVRIMCLSLYMSMCVRVCLSVCLLETKPFHILTFDCLFCLKII